MVSKRISQAILLLVITMCFFPTGDRLDAQGIVPNKFYLVTYDQVTEENRYSGQKATIWETNASTVTNRHLLTIERSINQTPRDLFPDRELVLLETSEFFPDDRADSPAVIQGLETIALLDADHLLIVTYREVREVMYNTAYGYYDLQLLNLFDGSLTSMMTIAYHPDFVDESWGCHVNHMVGFADFLPNPAAETFAFSVVPKESGCGGDYLGQSYIVDYSTLPVKVEILPFVRELSWSPDGSMLAYFEIPCLPFLSAESCAASIYMRPVVPEILMPKLIYQFNTTLYYPKLLTWLDTETLLYQYDERTLNECALWTAYNVTSDQVVFTEECLEFFEFGYLHDDESHLAWGWRGGNLVLMHLANDSIETVETLPYGTLFDNSKFSQYVFWRDEAATLHVLEADSTISSFDLSPFVPADQQPDKYYIVPGPRAD